MNAPLTQNKAATDDYNDSGSPDDGYAGSVEHDWQVERDLPEVVILLVVTIAIAGSKRKTDLFRPDMPATRAHLANTSLTGLPNCEFVTDNITQSMMM